jgi:hypothetical protein
LTANTASTALGTFVVYSATNETLTDISALSEAVVLSGVDAADRLVSWLSQTERKQREKGEEGSKSDHC